MWKDIILIEKVKVLMKADLIYCCVVSMLLTSFHNKMSFISKSILINYNKLKKQKFIPI
jgi:hypothetical protein